MPSRSGSVASIRNRGCSWCARAARIAAQGGSARSTRLDGPAAGGVALVGEEVAQQVPEGRPAGARLGDRCGQGHAGDARVGQADDAARARRRAADQVRDEGRPGAELGDQVQQVGVEPRQEPRPVERRVEPLQEPLDRAIDRVDRRDPAEGRRERGAHGLISLRLRGSGGRGPGGRGPRSGRVAVPRPPGGPLAGRLRDSRHRVDSASGRSWPCWRCGSPPG